VPQGTRAIDRSKSVLFEIGVVSTLSIFSTYSQRENRITSTFLAVLQELSLSRIDALLGSILGDDTFNSITFANQPSVGAAGVPDAVISSGMHIVIETKVVRNTVDESQLLRHLERLDKVDNDGSGRGNNIGASSYQKLIVLTPDANPPEVVEKINDDRIVWASFQGLDSSIDELFKDERSVFSEKEQLILREFQKMMSNSLLLNPDKDTVIVPAKNAWEIYQKASVYACQVNRSFQPAEYIGFYADQHIQRVLAKIEEIHDNISMEKGRYDKRLGESVDSLLKVSPQLDGVSLKIFVLSSIESDSSIKLPNLIKNDKKSYSGKNTAFVQGQRYVVSEELLKAKFTSDID